jgi:hypothetical protein
MPTADTSVQSRARGLPIKYRFDPLPFVEGVMAMSTGKEKRKRARSIRNRRSRRPAARGELYKSSTTHPASEEGTAARDHYQREKERRANRTRPHDHPLEQARRAYQALLAADAAKARGGRPRKVAATKSPVARADEHSEE